MEQKKQIMTIYIQYIMAGMSQCSFLFFYGLFTIEPNRQSQGQNRKIRFICFFGFLGVQEQGFKVQYQI